MARVKILHSPFVPGHFKRAARIYAAANRSDPFAYSRMICHLRRGIEDASEITKTWFSRTRTMPAAQQDVRAAT